MSHVAVGNPSVLHAGKIERRNTLFGEIDVPAKKRVAPVTLATAAEEWLKLKKPTLAPKSYELEEGNLKNHLKPTFGSMLLISLAGRDGGISKQGLATKSPQAVGHI